MYIKLGSINLQYYQETNDWMILGEIVDSGMSYEKPILVRTTEELDIWFGKNFKSYSYMQELINMGVVLYLYKPISNKTAGGDNYIDLDQYTEVDNVWLRDVETGWIGKVVESPEKYKFEYNTGNEIKTVGFVINSEDGLELTEDIEGRDFCTEETVRTELISPVNQISEIYDNKIKFHVFNSENLWIYYEGEILDTTLLPQNINLTSLSLNNRDTLVISSPEDTLDFTYLDYNNEENSLGIYSDKELIDQLEGIDEQYLFEIDMSEVSEGYQSLMFRIIGSSLSDGDYFVFPNATHGTDVIKWELFYYGDLDKVPEEVRNMFDGRSTKVTTFRSLLSKIRGLGYNVIDYNGFYYMYSKTIIPVTNFYRSTNISIIPEIKITEAILSKSITTGAEVVSKTIGRSSEFEDDLIKFTLEKIGDKNYRAIITRLSYSETYEGSLEFSLGEQRLDNLITQQSKLVRCNFYGTELRTGTYYLRGAVTEQENPEMYKYSLKSMLSAEYNDPVYPDYFLIPDKYKFTSDIINDNPYPLFLDYSKEVGCQFLIENKSVEEFYKIEEVDEFPTNPEEGTYYKVGDTYYDSNHEIVIDPFFYDVVLSGGDFVYNLTTDEDNRLVYFFRKMSYYYSERPGYYAYLRGILLNNFSISVGDILYRTPTSDAFLEEDIEDTLKNYKSNYLVCDNQTYFYKDYQDGKTYIMTGFTRFIAGKIFRELQKNSGEILGQQLLGVVRSKISDLLYSIENGFSIVDTIRITEFEPDDKGQSLKISLETVMNDQIKNNVNLDITVNYNNITYGTIS